MVQPHLGNSLGLVCLLSIVSSNTLSFDTLRLCIFFLILAEKIDFFIVTTLGGSGSGGATQEGFPSLAASRKRAELGGIRLDMLVPPCYIWMRSRLGCDRFKDMNVGLRRSVSEIEKSVTIIIDGRVVRKLGK
jgi:hypothetical protein